MIAAAKIGPATYENGLQDRRYGITRQWLQEAKEAWLEFDCRQLDNEINNFPNYTSNINHDGTDFTMHFVALFSTNVDAIPILMLHGWPGSFLEFLPLLNLIRKKYTPATLPYHLIVPSLPGHGYSPAPPLDKDFRLEDCAQIFDNLMVQLSFGDKGYVVQGGDVGSKVARVLGGVHPRAKAVHLNFCIMPDPGSIDASFYNELEREGLKRAEWFHKLGSAYALEHATKPSTIGLVLSTNPMALLAWIGEKMLDWSDGPLPLKTILADATLYWLTNTISTSFWPYRQLFTPGVIGAHENPKWYIGKPLGFSWCPKEIAPVPRAWVETTGKLVWYRQHDQGGHFAALEQPEVLLDDLEHFVKTVWEH